MIRKKLGVYLFILALALIGLLWIQYIWINYSFRMQDEKFTNKVNGILEEIVKEVEESYYCLDLFSATEFKIGDSFVFLKNIKSDEEESVTPGSTEQRGAVTDTIVNFLWWRYKDIDTIFSYKEFEFDMYATMRTKMNIQFRYEEGEIGNGFDGDRSGSDKITIESFRRSISDNEDILNALDTLVKQELDEIDINHEFQYAVTEFESDSLVYSNTANLNPKIFKSKIRTVIFDESFFFKAYSVYIFFPGKNKIIFSSLLLMIFSSIAVVCAIIILILFFIRTMLNQKRLSEMKSDFIHNMTHEFKTPISNINLALHAFNNQNQESKIEKDDILEIIQEENTRLKSNVDLILQTSFMDYYKLEFNKELVNVNDLLSVILKTCGHDLVNNGSTFKINLEAANAELMIDRTHFTNAICNIIDNAIKYTPVNPVINVKTENRDSKFIISIRDNGIGISEKDQKRIFEKFYRVHTGKVHDIKGFGLGLSYTKYVINAHSGEIIVRSEPGKGTELRIILET